MTALLDVPLIRQRPELPTGCEAVALTMALHYYGVNVDKETVVRQMPRDSTPLIENPDGSVRSWGDPEVGFVGDPYGDGVTINPKPLKQVLDHYRGGGTALYGKDFKVIEQAVGEGKPVLVWFTISHEMPVMRYWKTPAGKMFLPRDRCTVLSSPAQMMISSLSTTANLLSGAEKMFGWKKESSFGFTMQWDAEH
ncbi:C39 family peptidase [Sporolactobacillus sp. Y61]|uniref:C39 family peptidase n=1 Tax=Sporolactobacillus sp. Y61 TaxID=3160863 RepID=A0AAU8IFU5_9BACL